MKIVFMITFYNNLYLTFYDIFLSLQTSVTDADTPVNSKNLFKIQAVVPHFNISLPQTSIEDFSMSQSGSLKTNIRFRPDIIGYYGISIEVYDDTGKTDTAEVKVSCLVLLV